MFNTLKFIGEKLNEAEVTWAVGASILLYHHSLVDNPKDIDILVDITDIHKVDNILKNLGEKTAREKCEDYSTEYFYEYVIKEIDVDVMAGFIINHEEGSYKYTFDKISINETMDIDGVKIPLTSLEDWYVLYQLIPRRQFKVELIENYLKLKGIRREDLLRRALTKELSIEVRCKIQNMLTNL